MTKEPGDAFEQTPYGDGREALLSAAALLARKEGFDSLSIEKVARLAGVTKGAVSHHFPARNDLMMGMLAQIAEPFKANLASTRERNRTFAAALIETTISEIKENGEFLAVLSTAAVLDPSVTKFVDTINADCIEQMTREGLPLAKALLIRSALDGAIHENCLRGGADTDTNELALLQSELVALTTLGSRSA